MSERPSSHPSQLPISNVSVASTRAFSEHQLVYCQRRSATISIQACQQCPHFESVRFDSEDDPGVVVCDEAPPEPEPQGSLSLPRLSVGDLMKRDVLCVRPDLPLEAASLLMLEQGTKVLPVVDHEGRVLGTVSDADIQLEIQACREDVPVVSLAMAPGAVTVPEATPATRAAAVMAFEGVDCVIALSPAGAVVGLLKAEDLLCWLGSADGYLPRVRKCGTK